MYSCANTRFYDYFRNVTLLQPVSYVYIFDIMWNKKDVSVEWSETRFGRISFFIVRQISVIWPHVFLGSNTRIWKFNQEGWTTTRRVVHGEGGIRFRSNVRGSAGAFVECSSPHHTFYFLSHASYILLILCTIILLTLSHYLALKYMTKPFLYILYYITRLTVLSILNGKYVLFRIYLSQINKSGMTNLYRWYKY